MVQNKLRVIQDYRKLSKELQEQVKLAYPEGFSDYLITFSNAKGEIISALRFETEEKIYLLRMSLELAVKIVEEDSDYDDDNNLKSEVREEYEAKHSDMDDYMDNEEEDDDSYDDDEGDVDDED